MKVKKILAIVLALAMVFAFAACSDTTGGTEGNSGGDAANAGSSGEESYSFATEGSFKIGGIGPLTGGASIYGTAVKNGAQLAVDEINAAGGINGYKVEFQMEDDEHNAEKSTNAYGSLKDWGMQILMGTVTSGPCTAVSAEAAGDNMFMLTPSGSAVDSISAGDTIFRICFSDPTQGAMSAEYISTNSVASTVGIIYNSSDVYSTGIKDTFVSRAGELNLNIVGNEAFTEDSKTDFTAQLTNLKNAGAELVFLPIYTDAAALILQQASSMGWDPIFFGCDGLDGILSVENFDASLAEGVMLLTPFVPNATDAATKGFVDGYKAAGYDEAYLNQFAADAYDAIYTIKAAIEKAGATPDMEVSALGDALKAAMTEIEVVGVTGTMTWSADGEPSKEPKAVKIENGVYVEP